MTEPSAPLEAPSEGPTTRSSSPDIGAREQVWQRRWRDSGLGRAVVTPGRPKFSIVFAYPGTSGFMHIGHMRGYTLADAIARYHRMKGEEVLFPGGIHASGLPAVTFSSKVARRDPDTVEALELWGIRGKDLSRLEEPEEAARFLGETYWTVWERFGMVMDRSAYVTTIDPDYRQFIRWQFLRLQKLGRLVQKPYYAPFCPRSGPVSVDASETDLDRGGNAEIVTYTALAFRLADGRRVLCATLRPETVYGVTNLWVPAEGSLVEWKHQGESYLVSEAGASKLLEQVGGEKGGDVPVVSLEGELVVAPFTNAKVPVLRSPLVDPLVGTGAVMSVPAHAPADWVAVNELSEPKRAPLIASAKVLLTLRADRLAPSERELFQGEGPPAAQAVRQLGVQGLSDSERLQEATERVYRAEHAHGEMTVDPYRGQSVEEARVHVAEEAIAHEYALEIREFSEPVICRCGEKVVIRRIPDQWFLAYGDRGWKEQVRGHLGEMRIFPSEYGAELPGILDWFEDRPAVRQGKWLGTPFPQDPRWIIEPIADSTFYPAYYIVRRFVSDGRLKVEQLTPAFFDHVFTGEGPGEPSVAPALLEEVRREFLYFYPLDLNLGGKEHKRVHFPPFLYNHIALLPAPLWPKGIFVNWWITGRSGKISKKDVKGGAVPPVDRALSSWGADGLRLYYALAATPFQDAEWDEEACARAAERAQDVLRLLGPLLEGVQDFSAPTPSPSDHLGRWFSSAVHQLLARVRAAFEDNDHRRAAESLYVELPTLLRRYRGRGGADSALLRSVGSAWVRAVAPITPHLAEEAWGEERALRIGFVARARFPGPTELPLYPEAMAREALVDLLEEDIASLLKAWKSPAIELRLFVAADWKRVAESTLRAALAAGTSPDLGSLMKALRAREELKPRLGEVPQFLKLYDLRELASEAPAPTGPLTSEQEGSVWEAAVPFLRERFGLREVQVIREELGKDLDPRGRRQRARPGRPALYLVESPPASAPERGRVSP